MGSLGEEDFESLVIGYFESAVTISEPMEKSSRALVTLKEILETKGEMEKEIEDKIMSFIKRKRLSYEGDDEKKDALKKIVSKLRSDGYDVSLSRTSWDSSFDRQEGSRVFRCTRKYEYIDVMMASDGDGADVTKRVIADLDFKSQFELAKPTKGYKDMTEMLPRVFVATEERLKRVVKLVCGEMKKSMKEEGMPRPPWRTRTYMQAKWSWENRERVVTSSKKVSSWTMFDVDEATEAVGTTSGTAEKTTCCFSIF